MNAKPPRQLELPFDRGIALLMKRAILNIYENIQMMADFSRRVRNSILINILTIFGVFICHNVVVY